MNPRFLTDILRTVFDSMPSHKLRAALTLTGVFGGMGAIVQVSAILTELLISKADV